MYIKSTLLMGIIALSLTKVLAQTRPVNFGVKVGINSSTLSRNIYEGNRIANPDKMLIGYTMGAYAIFNKGRFALQSGANFTANGAKTTTEYNYGDVVTDYHGTMRLYYIQVPVNLLYRFPVKGGGQYYIGAGAWASRAIKGSFSPKLQGTNEEIPDRYREGLKKDIEFGTNPTDTFKALDYGLNALAGFKFKSNLFFNLNYDLGLNNIEANKYPYNTNYTSTRTRSAVLSVGFEF